jgi:uroporphyrinogen decarboxylase
MFGQQNPDSSLLQAFRGTNTRVPVWLMRQAGRYLPQYQAIKKERTLDEMFKTPELAARVTLLPVELLKVDAAILFADILTMPSGMGFKISFVDGKGPVVENPVRSDKDIDRIYNLEHLTHVSETIRLVNQQLSWSVPLIGFAGSPFTVAHYLIEGKGSLGLPPVVKFALEQPKAFHALMRKLTDNTVAYLNYQKIAGIKVFQLFDTWGGVLRQAEYDALVLPYVQEIFQKVDLPSIYYLKNCSHLLASMERSGAEFLSVCETVTIGNNSYLNNWQKGVQGNFYNGLLYAEDNIIREEIRTLLTAARAQHPKYIFNLSHGIFPDVSVDKIKLVVNEVHKFKW